MSKYDDMYEGAGAEKAQSQVRGIIQQLNDEKPSKEKSREVVIRSDGTKVVRVTKKRRVLVSDADKRKAGRRSFMLILLGACLLCFVAVGVLLYRMSVMGGDGYVQQYEEQLKTAWGAERVTITGQGVNGMEFHLSGVVAEFPSSSIVQRVELSDLSAELDTSTFFTNLLSADKLTIRRAEVLLNPDVRDMQMPRYAGTPLWRFRRTECECLHVRMGNIMEIKDAAAYAYHPRVEDKTICSLVLDGGTMQLKGMQLVRLADAKLLCSLRGIDEFSLTGTTDGVRELPGKERSSLSILGRLPIGAALSGPYEFDSVNMPFSFLTEGRFGRVLTAKTVPQIIGREHSRARITLPLDSPAPIFSGDFELAEICVNGFPIQTMITEHMESAKRGSYTPAVISRGRLVLSHEGSSLTVEFPENLVAERDVMSLSGRMSLNADNAFGGSLSIGIPAILTHAEYADGKADPIFTESAGMSWVTVALSGTVNIPTDNSAQLDAEAEEVRRTRPGRLNLDEMDFGKVSERLRRDRELFNQVDSNDSPSETSSPSSPQPQRQQQQEELFGTGSLDMGSPLDRKSIFD